MAPTPDTSDDRATSFVGWDRAWKPLGEWAVWIALAAAAWSQMAYFDEPIPGYALGATGWPKAVCVAIAIGATGQLLLKLFSGRTPGAASGPAARDIPWDRLAKGVAIFALPFLFVWGAERIGFYVACPLFVLALMLLLEVRSWKPLLGVTLIVWGLVLVVFTRLFYVALPVGRWDPFYGWNEAIIELARIGS